MDLTSYLQSNWFQKKVIISILVLLIKILRNTFIWFSRKLHLQKCKNFIRSKPEGALALYSNLADVRVTGFDGSFHYGYKNWLTFEINATQQRSLNQGDFDPPWTNIKNDYKGTQIENIPIFYSNANLGFNFRKIRTADDNLSVNLFANYIGEYYLKSTKNGDPSTRRTIPEQFTQSIATAYVFGKGKYNVGLECNNITDKKYMITSWYKNQEDHLRLNSDTL